MTSIISPSDTSISCSLPIIGDTHLLVNGNLVRLLKCPFCNFRNINERVIDRHILHTEDAEHDADLQSLDKVRYIVTRQRIKSSPYGKYFTKKEDLKLPWIRCLWCDYKDKINFDLSLHLLEEHRDELLAIPITRAERHAAKNMIKNCRARLFAKFESPMEYRLDKAIKITREKSKSGSAE